MRVCACVKEPHPWHNGLNRQLGACYVLAKNILVVLLTLFVAAQLFSMSSAFAPLTTWAYDVGEDIDVDFEHIVTVEPFLAPAVKTAESILILGSLPGYLFISERFLSIKVAGLPLAAQGIEGCSAAPQDKTNDLWLKKRSLLI